MSISVPLLAQEVSSRLKGRPVVVLGVHTFTGERIVEMLQQAGIPVAVMWPAIKRETVSRRISSMPLTGEYPPPYADEEQFVAAVAEFAASVNASAVLCRGAEVFLVAKDRERFGDIEIIAPPIEKMLELHSKAQLPAIAAAAGVATPKTIALFDESSCDPVVAWEKLQQMELPVVVKRVHSTGSFDTRFITSPSSFSFEAMSERLRWPSIVQQMVEGEVCSVGVICAGEVVVPLGMLRDYEVPSARSGWVMRRETIDEAELEADALAVARQANFSGVLHLEFIRTLSGERYLIEANPRVWTGMSAVMNGGVNAPLLMLAAQFGLLRPETRVPHLRSGMKCLAVPATVSAAVDHLRRWELREAFGLIKALLQGRLGLAEVVLEDRSLIRIVLRKTWDKVVGKLRRRKSSAEEWAEECDARDRILNTWDPNVPDMES